MVFDEQEVVPERWAGGRCYVSYNHFLGGATGFHEHDQAKVGVTIGHLDKTCHRKKESDVVPPANAQALRNYATDLHTAGHAGPALFRAALKSGAHPSKCIICVPVLGNRIGGGFSNYDRQRSKEVLIPEGKAFVSYLIETLKVCRQYKAEIRAGWLGHSKARAWRSCKDAFRQTLRAG